MTVTGEGEHGMESAQGLYCSRTEAEHADHASDQHSGQGASAVATQFAVDKHLRGWP